MRDYFKNFHDVLCGAHVSPRLLFEENTVPLG